MYHVVFASLLSVALAGLIQYPDQPPPSPYGAPPPPPPTYGSTPPPTPRPTPPVYTTPASTTYTYPTPAPTTYAYTTSKSVYGPPPTYGEQNCKTYYETVQVDKCEKYTDKVCYTTQQETCQDIPDQTCNAAVTTVQERPCFNITELKCRLKEDIQYETVQAVFTVQKCQTDNERVCDTVYETEDSNIDDFKCITVQNPVCNSVDKTIYDKTCHTTTNFDCKTGSDGEYGGSSDGYGTTPSAYGGSPPAYGGSPSAYGGSPGAYGGGDGGYCKRTSNTQCYNTPRIVTSEVCYPKDQQLCQKLSNKVPVPKQRQVCHNEEKKECELEQKTQPKQVKKYVYSVSCDSVPRLVCSNASTKKLVPNCVPVNRKSCTYTPVEKCEDQPKEYCYKVPTKVPKQKCYGPGGYPDDDHYESS